MTALAVEAPAGTDTGSGSFTGYLAAFGKDLGGDTIGPGAMDQTLADFRAGRMSWLITDGHADPNDTTGVVAYVTDAELDGAGLRVRGNWLPGERAQQLRKLANAGAPLGLSIDYLANSHRPDGQGGRYLDAITVTGGAVVRTPMNSMARITESKGGATFPPSAPVVTRNAAIAADAERHQRSDPDRQRQDARIAAAGWIPKGLPRDLQLQLLDGLDAARSKALAASAMTESEAMLQARRDVDNAYSSGLARWMAAHR